MKNPAGKTRKLDNPYEVYKSVGPDGSWEYRVLKKYLSPESEAKDPYARWFVAVKSPFTFGSFEYGDSYARDVKANAAKVYDLEADAARPMLSERLWKEAA
ncbi:hypothetical protein LCGC14_2724080 [marine sediment metagenome]|uniref:Uncharacterized protein n=1 Tax=marine sediment metagenome TaxID=412755 RepID=A0A0F9C0X8_9ZZZZ